MTRDPMTWSVPAFTAFGVPVRIHLFFFIVTLGLFLRQVFESPHIWWLDIFLLTVVLLFGIILIHEFGHVFGARAVGGDASEVLIWPLGGLAQVDAPHHPKALLTHVAAGPAMNVVICLLTGIIIAGAGFIPMLNPLGRPYESPMRNYRDGRVYTSVYGMKLYKKNTADEVPAAKEQLALIGTDPSKHEASAYPVEVERALAPTFIVWLNRAFWLSWILLLLNLIPAYPLDGGQMLQAILWMRSNYTQATQTASYIGFVVGVLALIASIASNEVLVAMLGMFIFYHSIMRLHSLEAEEGAYGDFSQGYTSLEGDDSPAPPVKRRGNVIQRWLQARAAKRIQREYEERQRDEERMDQLLDKIAKTGKLSLTEEERRFMERVSARYRNK